MVIAEPTALGVNCLSLSYGSAALHAKVIVDGQADIPSTAKVDYELCLFDRHPFSLPLAV